MSELIVLGYDDHDTAKKAYQQVLSLQNDYVVDLTGLAVVTVDADGKSHVDTPGKTVGAGALLGGAMGALMGRLAKSGIDAAFRERVQAMLTPGRGAVVIMASKLTQDKFTEAMKPFGGDVLQTSLSSEDEKELAEGIAGS
jgi:uncharacterized membrane protein